MEWSFIQEIKILEYLCRLFLNWTIIWVGIIIITIIVIIKRPLSMEDPEPCITKYLELFTHSLLIRWKEVVYS